MDDSSHQNMDNASSHERMFEEGIEVMHPARKDSDDMASVDERLEF